MSLEATNPGRVGPTHPGRWGSPLWTTSVFFGLTEDLSWRPEYALQPHKGQSECAWKGPEEPLKQ